MDTIQFLREQRRQAQDFLMGTLAEVSVEHAHAPMPGAMNPIGATYAHLATGEDGFVNGLIRGGVPLFASDWAGKTGISEMPPQDGDWQDWGKRVRVDLVALSAYGAAVAASTDAYLATLTPNDLDRTLDLSAAGFGEKSVGWVLGAGVLGHVLSHWGELCALHGALGGRGFPR